MAGQKRKKNAMQRVPGKAGLVVGGGAVLGWASGQIAATGSTVEVIYLPEASPDAWVNTAAHLLVPGLLAVVAGGLVLALALTLILAFTPGTFSVGTVIGRWLMPAILLVDGAAWSLREFRKDARSPGFAAAVCGRGDA